MKVIVCLKDLRSDLFLQPMFVPAVGLAYRSISDEIRRGGEGNTLADHPGDFSMYKIGGFDEATGVITAFDRPEFLLECATMVLPKE